MSTQKTPATSMEAMAAKTESGTYQLAIARTPTGDVGQLDLHISMVPGADTEGPRRLLESLAEDLGNEGERYLVARLYALALELEQQDEGRRVP